MEEYKKQLYKNYSSGFTQQVADFSDKAVEKFIHNLKEHYDQILLNYDNSVKIIDLGCGPGNLLTYLKREGFTDITGIDYSQEEVEIAVSKGLTVRRDDILSFLQSTETKFDIIFMHDVIEHFKKNEVIEIFNRVYKILNPGGVFIIHTPNGLGLHSEKIIYGDITHSTILTPNSAKQLFINAGFNRIDFYETEPFAKNAKGVIRLFIWKVIKLIANFKIWIETGGTEKYLTRNFVAAGFKK